MWLMLRKMVVIFGAYWMQVYNGVISNKKISKVSIPRGLEWISSSIYKC